MSLHVNSKAKHERMQVGACKGFERKYKHEAWKNMVGIHVDKKRMMNNMKTRI